MPTPKRIQPDEPIGLKLGVSERLMIQQLPLVEREIAERVAKAPKEEKKIGFTLDELDDLIGHVAAELNHTENESKQHYLEQIYNKIDHLLHAYTDQPEPPAEPQVIQAVMGWQNCHLYSFQAGDDTYCDPTMCQDTELGDGRRIKLSYLAKQGHEQLEYVYDFGDHWQHLIEIESAFQPEAGVTFPVCLEGGGTSPPEDVGGSMGYEEFLRIINDPDDEEHQHYLEWCGGWFDPEAFDLELVNRALGKMP